MLRVHEGPVETPQLWREVTINKKTTVRDVIVSMKNDADWSDLVLFLKIFFYRFIFQPIKSKITFYFSTNKIKYFFLLDQSGRALQEVQGERAQQDTLSQFDVCP